MHVTDHYYNNIDYNINNSAIDNIVHHNMIYYCTAPQWCLLSGYHLYPLPITYLLPIVAASRGSQRNLTQLNKHCRRKDYNT